MTRFDWKMTPQEFVQALEGWSRRMRRISGATIGGRRHVREVLRRRRKWYRGLNDQVELPEAQRSLASTEWSLESASSVQIVIQQESMTAMSEDPPPESEADLRKGMRRLLHAAAEGGEGRAYALTNSRASGRRIPSIGRRPDGPIPEPRALYLEALGVAIVPQLSRDEQTALEEAGAIVVPNELITIDEPSGDDAVAADGTATHLTAIDVEAARTEGLTGKGVRIGVLDTGIDASHPEFAGRSVEFMSFKTSGAPRAMKAKDYGTHGTHVAALCGGRTVGVAPEADLVVAAVLTERGEGNRMSGYTAQILAGMDWLAGGGGQPKAVDLVNASLGGPNSAKSYLGSVAAYRLNGILTVAAIGNDGRRGIGRHSAPAKLECALGVGAIDDDGRVADFSDWGPCHDADANADYKPDIMAPGVQVRSAVPGKGYERKNGTSMACPIVTGAAALLIEQDEGLRGDPDALTARLLGLTMPLPPQPAGYDSRRGGRGRLVLTSIAKQARPETTNRLGSEHAD